VDVDRSRSHVPAIDEDRCKGCGLCVEFCPFGHLRIDEQLNVAGYHPAHAETAADVLGDSSRPAEGTPDVGVEPFDHNFSFWCVRCRYCELACPDAAIRIDGDVTGMEGAAGRLDGSERGTSDVDQWGPADESGGDESGGDESGGDDD